MHFYSGTAPQFRCLTLLLALAFYVIVGFLIITHFPQFIFALKVGLFILVLSSIPTIVTSLTRKPDSFASAIIQAILATTVVVLFVTIVNGVSSLGGWIAILLLLLLVLLVGSHLIHAMQKLITTRLSLASDFSFSSTEIERLEESTHQQNIFYLSIPLGLIIATGYGWLNRQSENEILILSVPLIFGLASIILVVFLIVCTGIMCKPLLLADPKTMNNATPKSSPNSFWEKITIVFRSILNKQIVIQNDFSNFTKMVYLAGDVRRVYFYDAVHSTILIIAFVISLVAAVDFLFITQHAIAFIVAAALMLFVFCYLPFSIGQNNLYETILQSVELEGIPRKELKEALLKASPLYPQSEFIGALVATGTIGGLLTALMFEFLKNAFK